MVVTGVGRGAGDRLPGPGTPRNMASVPLVESSETCDRKGGEPQQNGWGPRSGPGGRRPSVIELNLVGVRLEMPSQQPIVLLKERDGERFLPIWIGQPEANAIAFGQQGIVTQRPMTHDLLKLLLDEFNVSVDRIVITELKEGTFYATIRLLSNGTAHEISSRPSDAIALAVRVRVPIFASEEVLDEASITVHDEEEETEVEKFREFLESVNPEDFQG